MLTSQLRARFLTALAASGAIVGASLAACGGSVQTEGTGTSGGTTSGGTSGGTSGYSSSGTSNPPSKPPPPSTSLPPGPSPVACEYGKPATECYTRAQLENQLRYPNRGGDVADAGDPDADVSQYFDQNGCLPKESVRDGCCNSAVSGPVFNGSTCCYVHCTGACCGRPFLVDGEARVASVIERSDWMTAPTMRSTAFAPLDAEHRDRIATAWARDAAMEHASVASFARFTLELLALGAPADIVLGAQDAARDEVEHATACFAIASRYAGRNLGPGKLDVGGSSSTIELEHVVTAAIVEGCIGETLSALLAEARLARAEDADVRAALRRIANEEAHHAELAWRFVGWAITLGGADLRAAAASAFETALARAPQAFDTSLRGIPPETLRAHGLLDEDSAREVASHTLDEVIRPCAEALVRDVATIAA